jgi:hypothetical protein
VAGFISEPWPASNRNDGRHQFGTGGRLASESALYDAADPVYNGYLIESAANGATSVTCATAAEAGNFADGDRVVLHGFAQQHDG